MSILKKSMLIEPHDNVAVAVEPIEAGEATMVGGEEIVANQFIKEGHKIARTDIAKGDEIIKYGVHIGVATQDIKKGDWVHENNAFNEIAAVVYDDFLADKVRSILFLSASLCIFLGEQIDIIFGTI